MKPPKGMPDKNLFESLLASAVGTFFLSRVEPHRITEQRMTEVFSDAGDFAAYIVDDLKIPCPPRAILERLFSDLSKQSCYITAIDRNTDEVHVLKPLDPVIFPPTDLPDKKDMN